MVRKAAGYKKVDEKDIEIGDETYDKTAPFFQVTPPCDLEAGFEFAVSLSGTKYKVTVVRRNAYRRPTLIGSLPLFSLKVV